jgi:hypothetical protein
MRLKPRTFLFDEEENRLHRIPYARFERVLRGKQPLTLFRGKSMLAIMAYVQHDEVGEDHLCLIEYMKVSIDANGVHSEEERLRRFTDAARSLDLNGDWIELNQFHAQEKYGWKPPHDIAARLEKMVRSGAKHE